MAIINLINGLFHTDYPLDSKVTYNWTEFVDDKLKRILADTIITINGKYSYHLEAQIERDNTIVFRVFEYGFHHANRERMIEDGRYILPFPKPIVIYLYYEGNVPDEYELVLEFEEGKEGYSYKVPVMKLQDTSVEELNERKMIILVPFHILKLRKMIKDRKGNPLTEEDLSELKRIIHCDIIGSIRENQKAGNIAREDAVRLIRYVQQLWEYLQKHHKELEVCVDMTDQSFMTDVDILCDEFEERIDAICAEYNQKVEEYNKKMVDAKESFEQQIEDISGSYEQQIEDTANSMKTAMTLFYEKDCKTVEALLEHGIPKGIAEKVCNQ